MADSTNPYSNQQSEPKPVVAGIDYLLVSGNVKKGKSKGGSQLLLTPTAVFGLGTDDSAMATGVAVGGLLGGLVAHLIQKKRDKRRPVGEHMSDPLVIALGEDVGKKIEKLFLIAKVKLDSSVLIERTRLGFKFVQENEEPLVFHGLIHKRKVTDFLNAHGFDVR